MRDDTLLLSGLWLGVFASIVSASAYSPLIPPMRSELGFSFGQFGLMTTAYYIPYTALQIVAGHTSARGHIRILMLPGMGVLIASTILLGQITSLPEALVLRALGGAASATIFVPSLIVISKRFPGRTNYALGIFATGANAATLYVSLVAPSLSGWLGWRLAIGTMMLPCFGVWAAIYFAVKDFTPTQTTPAVDRGALRSEVLGRSATWILGLQNFIRVGLLGALLTFIPAYFATGLGYSVELAGVALTVFSVMAIVSSLSSIRIARALKSNSRVMLLSMGVMGAALFAAGFVGAGIFAWVLAAVLGLFVFTAFGPAFSMASQIYADESLGIGMGIQNTLATGGSVVIPLLFGYARDVTGTFVDAWLMLAAFAATAFCAGWALVRLEMKGFGTKGSPPSLKLSRPTTARTFEEPEAEAQGEAGGPNA
jgi:MFS family permease